MEKQYRAGQFPLGAPRQSGQEPYSDQNGGWTLKMKMFSQIKLVLLIFKCIFFSKQRHIALNWRKTSASDFKLQKYFPPNTTHIYLCISYDSCILPNNLMSHRCFLNLTILNIKLQTVLAPVLNVRPDRTQASHEEDWKWMYLWKSNSRSGKRPRALWGSGVGAGSPLQLMFVDAVESDWAVFVVRHLECEIKMFPSQFVFLWPWGGF